MVPKQCSQMIGKFHNYSCFYWEWSGSPIQGFRTRQFLTHYTTHKSLNEKNSNNKFAILTLLSQQSEPLCHSIQPFNKLASCTWNQESHLTNFMKQCIIILKADTSTERSYTHTIKLSARPNSKMKHKPSLHTAWDTQNSVLILSRGAFQFTAPSFVI